VARHAANLAGGLHHAMPAAACGFCVYNDPVIAIKWLLGHGADRQYLGCTSDINHWRRNRSLSPALTGTG
jgi:hypothetical protein